MGKTGRARQADPRCRLGFRSQRRCSGSVGLWMGSPYHCPAALRAPRQLMGQEWGWGVGQPACVGCPLPASPQMPRGQSARWWPHWGLTPSGDAGERRGSARRKRSLLVPGEHRSWRTPARCKRLEHLRGVVGGGLSLSEATEGLGIPLFNIRWRPWTPGPPGPDSNSVEGVSPP